jgi:aspartate ammonia-lyase
LAPTRRDLRWLATGARLREWQPGEWLFHESTPYDWTGIIEDGDVDIVRGLHGDEHLLYTLGTGSMVSEGAILGNTAHFASARTRTRARLWVITRETMDYVRQQNPQAYYRIVAHIGQRLADRVRLLSDASSGRVHRGRCWRCAGSATCSETARSQAARTSVCRRCAPSRTSRSPESPCATFRVSSTRSPTSRRLRHGQCRTRVLSNEKRDATAQACDEITAGHLHDQFVVDMIQGGAGTLHEHERQR